MQAVGDDRGGRRSEAVLAIRWRKKPATPPRATGPSATGSHIILLTKLAACRARRRSRPPRHQARRPRVRWRQAAFQSVRSARYAPSVAGRASSRWARSGGTNNAVMRIPWSLIYQTKGRLAMPRPGTMPAPPTRGTRPNLHDRGRTRALEIVIRSPLTSRGVPPLGRNPGCLLTFCGPYRQNRLGPGALGAPP